MVTELQIEKAKLLLPHLVHYAKKEQTITYKEIGKDIGHHHRSFYGALGYIRDDCTKRGYPLINALVVLKKTQLPGEGWLPDDKRKLTGEETKKLYEKEKTTIFACKKWDNLLKTLSLEPVKK